MDTARRLAKYQQSHDDEFVAIAIYGAGPGLLGKEQAEVSDSANLNRILREVARGVVVTALASADTADQPVSYVRRSSLSINLPDRPVF